MMAKRIFINKILFILWNWPLKVYQKSGCFVWKKGLNCDKLLNYIPVSWNKNEE